MSVPEGTLSDDFRVRLLDFYGRMLGWREMESLRLSDRLTAHLGILVGSATELRALWAGLASEPVDVELEPLSTNEHGEGSFRFRHLLPMAVEVQFYAALAGDASVR